jgi:hypothetical protein
MSAGIVPALDKLKDRHFGFGFGFKGSAVKELGFERREETLTYRIVVSITDRAH